MHFSLFCSLFSFFSFFSLFCSLFSFFFFFSSFFSCFLEHLIFCPDFCRTSGLRCALSVGRCICARATMNPIQISEKKKNCIKKKATERQRSREFVPVESSGSFEGRKGCVFEYNLSSEPRSPPPPPPSSPLKINFWLLGGYWYVSLLSKGKLESNSYHYYCHNGRTDKSSEGRFTWLVSLFPFVLFFAPNFIGVHGW